MKLLSKIFSNARKPEGFWERMMVAGMNGGSHAAMASWGLDLGDIPADGEILDIGCGGGANLKRLMQRIPKAKVTGVDYSPVSVEKSRSVNADAIANEDDGLTSNNEKWEKLIDGMHTYTPYELKNHLTAAGFKDIAIHQKDAKHWLVVTAVARD